MTSKDETTGWVRIGELSRRVGLSDHVLRAWERRYGLLSPIRTQGGYRLYSTDDERRVLRMKVLLARGLSTGEAARAALEDPTATGDALPGAGLGAGRPVAALSAPTGDLTDLGDRLARALETMDEPTAQIVVDELLATATVDDVVRHVVLPYLAGLGERWARGEISIAQEPCASNVLRGRLAARSRDWGNGPGPRALLACPPGERHDLALLAFGVLLGRRGWAVSYLGADTPLESVVGAFGLARPDLVVLAATHPDRFTGLETQLAALAEMAPLLLAGPGASQVLADGVGARLLSGDPVAAADALAR